MAEPHVYDGDTDQQLSLTINTNVYVFKNFTGDGPEQTVQDFPYVKIVLPNGITRYYYNPYLSESEMINEKGVRPNRITDCAFLKSILDCYRGDNQTYLRFAEDFFLRTAAGPATPVIWLTYEGQTTYQKIVQQRYRINNQDIAAYGPASLSVRVAPAHPDQDFYYQKDNEITCYPYFGFLQRYTTVKGSYMNLQDIPNEYHNKKYLLIQCGINSFEYNYRNSFTLGNDIYLTPANTTLYTFTYDTVNEQGVNQPSSLFILPTITWSLNKTLNDSVYISNIGSSGFECETRLTITLPKINGEADPVGKDHIYLQTQCQSFFYATTHKYYTDLSNRPEAQKGFVRFTIDCGYDNYAQYSNLTGYLYNDIGNILSRNVSLETLYDNSNSITFVPYQLNYGDETSQTAKILKMKINSNSLSINPQGDNATLYMDSLSGRDAPILGTSFSNSGSNQLAPYFVQYLNPQDLFAFRYFPSFMQHAFEDEGLGILQPSTDFYDSFLNGIGQINDYGYSNFTFGGNTISSWTRKQRSTYGRDYDYIFGSLSTDGNSYTVPVSQTTYYMQEDRQGLFYVVEYDDISE